MSAYLNIYLKDIEQDKYVMLGSYCGYFRDVFQTELNYNLKYDENKAAAILLPSNSGESHAKISAAQRARRRDFYNTSIEYEFNQGYRELI